MVRIYDRPDLDQRRGLPALYVTGSLPNGKPGLAYEGRLQIHNAIGACTVEQIDGDTLPPGHALYVDQQAGEVVIAWPEYAEVAAPITNPQFEDGMSGWAAGAGWSVTTDNPIIGTRSAVYARNPGSSILSSQSRYPVNHGTPIKAGCRVRQGASSAGNAGAGVRLEFRDATGAVIGSRDGNMVMQGKNNQVRSSDVTAVPPANASTVNIACHGLRKRQNRELWADDFSWDHKVAHAGINIETTLNLTLRVRDSAGRTALWSGVINIRRIAHDVYIALFASPNTSLMMRAADTNAWSPAHGVSPGGSTSLDHIAPEFFRVGGIHSNDFSAPVWQAPVVSPAGPAAISRPVRTKTGKIMYVTPNTLYSCLVSDNNGSNYTAVPRQGTSFGGGNQCLMVDSEGTPLRTSGIGLLANPDGDGDVWEIRAPSPAGGILNPSTTNFTYGRNGKTIAFAGRASAGGDQIAVSDNDGAGLKYVTIPGSGAVRNVAFNEGTWVAIATNGVYWATDPLGVWTQASIPAEWPISVSGSEFDIAPLGSGFIASAPAAVSTNLMETSDGKAWVLSPTRPAPSTSARINSITSVPL